MRNWKSPSKSIPISESSAVLPNWPKSFPNVVILLKIEEIGKDVYPFSLDFLRKSAGIMDSIPICFDYTISHQEFPARCLFTGAYA